MAKRYNKKKQKKQNKQIRNLIVTICLLVILSGAAYVRLGGDGAQENASQIYVKLQEATKVAGEKTGLYGVFTPIGEFIQNAWNFISPGAKNVQLDGIPEYAGSPFVEINNNIPNFKEEDLSTQSFERYSSLDFRGRCGVAYANIGQDLMPRTERESISSVTPSGWVNKKYDQVDQGYLYNRCHLIGYQLAGENANEKNLITGTRYLNVSGMLPLENLVADYVKRTGNHVLYRVTPIFEGKNLVASGVQMEAKSVEDNGAGVQFNVYCYNVQPGIDIDYATGDNWMK